jgi:putative transposase
VGAGLEHLRTTNVIESAFATVRLRERVTKGAGSRTKGLLMAFMLLDMAQQRWQWLDGAAFLPLVRAGVRLIDGVQKSARKPNQPNEAAPREAA